MKISRRYFTVGSASLLLTAASPYKLLANNSQKKKNLIVIMLRGAMDGLSAVPYIHDNTLQKVRPDIFVNNNLKLNSDFSLHPKLNNFHKIWTENKAGSIIYNKPFRPHAMKVNKEPFLSIWCWPYNSETKCFVINR